MPNNLSTMRRRLKTSASGLDTSSEEKARLPDVVLDERGMTPRIPAATRPTANMHVASVPKPLFSSRNQNAGETKRMLDMRDRKKLKPIWLAPDEGDQQIVRPPPLEGVHYSYVAASRFGQDVLMKIKRTDNLSQQLEKNLRFMDAVHTYEQSLKMLNRTIQKRSEAIDVTVEELKWLRIDYEIRCVQLVALCLLGVRKSDTVVDNTPFLLLKKAEELTSTDGLQYCKRLIQRASVYQSLANHYKKQKKLQASLQAAEKAVKINEKLPFRDRLPVSYFVKACLHGMLGDPSNAGLMYMECLNLATSQQDNVGATTTSSGDTNVQPDAFHVLKAATLHNMAVEWAILSMPDQSRECLTSAMEVAVHCLPQAHPVVTRILETYKVLRQGFVNRDPESTVRPATTPEGSNAPKQVPKPPPPKSPVAPTSPTESRSPRAGTLSRRPSSKQAVPTSLDGIPKSAPARPPDAKVSDSPRKRSARNVSAFNENEHSVRPASPGATRTTRVTDMPDQLFSHALGGKYNPNKVPVLQEARIFVARKRAACKIQKTWRATYKRHQRQRKTRACVRIQSISRMHLEHTRYQRTIHAVEVIQAAWRGALTRIVMAQRFLAAIKIQSAWRGAKEQTRYRHKRCMTVVLQSAMRGFLVRQQIGRKSQCAVVLQANMRRYIGRKTYKREVAAGKVITRALISAHAKGTARAHASAQLDEEGVLTHLNQQWDAQHHDGDDESDVASNQSAIVATDGTLLSATDSNIQRPNDMTDDAPQTAAKLVALPSTDDSQIPNPVLRRSDTNAKIFGTVMSSMIESFIDDCVLEATCESLVLDYDRNRLSSPSGPEPTGCTSTDIHLAAEVSTTKDDERVVDVSTPSDAAIAEGVVGAMSSLVSNVIATAEAAEVQEALSALVANGETEIAVVPVAAVDACAASVDAAVEAEVEDVLSAVMSEVEALTTIAEAVEDMVSTLTSKITVVTKVQEALLNVVTNVETEPATVSDAAADVSAAPIAEDKCIGGEMNVANGDGSDSAITGLLRSDTEVDLLDYLLKRLTTKYCSKIIDEVIDIESTKESKTLPFSKPIVRATHGTPAVEIEASHGASPNAAAVVMEARTPIVCHDNAARSATVAKVAAATAVVEWVHTGVKLVTATVTALATAELAAGDTETSSVPSSDGGDTAVCVKTAARSAAVAKVAAATAVVEWVDT
ncbi:TPA: hypothetical protein N0F65_007981, partial [Lagenidium giganteum]